MLLDTKQMNRTLKAKLAILPYREMTELSKEVGSLLHVDDRMVAECLVSLAEREDSEFVNKERAMLHQMFTRKKQIVILPYENGFKVSVPAQNIDVYCDDVRDGISQALDNLVAIRCMS